MTRRDRTPPIDSLLSTAAAATARYGGTIRKGCLPSTGETINIVDAFEGYGERERDPARRRGRRRLRARAGREDARSSRHRAARAAPLGGVVS